MLSFRVTVPEAARRLSVKEGAIRKRIERGTIKHEKSAEDGRVYVCIDVPPVDDGDATVHDTTYPAGYDALVKSQQEQIEFLRQQLQEEREANRENRRLLAGAVERIADLTRRIPPQLEPPREEQPEWPETVEGMQYGTSAQKAQESLHDHRPWWQRWFGTG